MRQEREEEVPIRQGGKKARVPEPQENFLAWEEGQQEGRTVNRKGREGEIQLFEKVVISDSSHRMAT